MKHVAVIRLKKLVKIEIIAVNLLIFVGPATASPQKEVVVPQFLHTLTLLYQNMVLLWVLIISKIKSIVMVLSLVVLMRMLFLIIMEVCWIYLMLVEKLIILLA